MSDKMPPRFIYPSAGEAEAVMHPSADTEVVDFKYCRDDGDLVTLDQVRLAVLHMFLFGTGAECGEHENTLAVIEKKVEAFMGLLKAARKQRDDSSADAASDRRVITWHDAGDEHP